MSTSIVSSDLFSDKYSAFLYLQKFAIMGQISNLSCLFSVFLYVVAAVKVKSVKAVKQQVRKFTCFKLNDRLYLYTPVAVDLSIIH